VTESTHGPYEVMLTWPVLARLGTPLEPVRRRPVRDEARTLNKT
jgi:hypothetical protein